MLVKITAMGLQPHGGYLTIPAEEDDMETRIEVQGRIFVLWMNPITGRREDNSPVAASSEYDRLVCWYESQKCEMYKDGWMNKQFKKGSKLEFFNPIGSTELNAGDWFHHGIYDEWVRLDELGRIDPPIRNDVVWLG